MSYRKKHYPPKPPRHVQQDLFFKEFRNPGQFRDLPSTLLTSGLPYQRPISEREIEALIRNWDDRLLDPLIVSFRDGKYNVIDGQHRLFALLKKNNDEAVTVTCLVLSGMTYQQEAELCYRIDHGKNRLSMADSIRAQLESGTNPGLNEIKRLTKAEGFQWPVSKTRGRRYEITPTRAVINAYELLGPDAFERMLQLLNATWAGEPDSLSAMMISGMALFIKTYETEFDPRTFAQHLSVASPTAIVNRGKSDYSTSNNALRCARVLLERYNKGCRNVNKLPYRFNG